MTGRAADTETLEQRYLFVARAKTYLTHHGKNADEVKTAMVCLTDCLDCCRCWRAKNRRTDPLTPSCEPATVQILGRSLLACTVRSFLAPWRASKYTDSGLPSCGISRLRSALMGCGRFLLKAFAGGRQQHMKRTSCTPGCGIEGNFGLDRGPEDCELDCSRANILPWCMAAPACMSNI